VTVVAAAVVVFHANVTNPIDVERLRPAVVDRLMTDPKKMLTELK